MRWWARPWAVWGEVGLILVAALAATATLAPSSPAVGFLGLGLPLWLLAAVPLALRPLWRRLTYRIGVRLFLSYLLIGIMPFLLLAAMAALGGYILVGQYTSVRLGDRLEGIEADLQRTAAAALAAAEKEGDDAAEGVLEAFRTSRGGELPAREWFFAAADGRVRASPGATAPPLPGWVAEAVTGPFLVEGDMALASVARRGDRRAAVLMRLDEEAAAVLSAGGWYEVRFLGGRVTARAGALEVQIGEEGEGPPAEAAAGGEAAAAVEAAEPEMREVGFATAGTGEGLWRSRWIYFVRLGRKLVRWSDGSEDPEGALVSFLLTSPAEALEDLFRSPYELGSSFLGIFLFISGFLFLLYSMVVAGAAVQIVSVARSTARLTRGTQRVEAGDLAHRIPVRRHDQLGDLALSFNRMAASVEEMLAEVAEKERLKRELELAREIQQSLLPGRELHHGPLSVLAFFRPAAEVGGDYFDLFPVGRQRLLVTVGDVAGHGLSTGLLMAMVKSAVATLVAEGHRGRELLVRLNRLMIEQPREHRMVTFAAADIDAGAGTATVTSAGHPPPILMAPGGEVDEVLLPSLPAGTRWREDPPSHRVGFPAGSRLVLYSDGLTEAPDGAGDPFGYQRLATFLRSAHDLPSPQLLEALLAELEHHTGATPQDDDLTVLVIERQGPAAAG